MGLLLYDYRDLWMDVVIKKNYSAASSTTCDWSCYWCVVESWIGNIEAVVQYPGCAIILRDFSQE